jgi:DNA polymerase-3 subunit epsilon
MAVPNNIIWEHDSNDTEDPNTRKRKTWEECRVESVLWSRQLLTTRDFILLDTETTGLGLDAQVVSVSLLSGHGLVLFDALVNPHSSIPAAATRAHHIEDKHVMLALDFTDIHYCLSKLLLNRQLVIYNAPFDTRILNNLCKQHGLEPLPYGEIHDAMMWYSQWVGEWNDYREDYKWQKLPDGDHTSIGDCKATLAIIEKMAADFLPGEEKHEDEVACSKCGALAKYQKTTETWQRAHIYLCPNRHVSSIVVTPGNITGESEIK